MTLLNNSFNIAEVLHLSYHTKDTTPISTHHILASLYGKLNYSTQLHDSEIFNINTPTFILPLKGLYHTHYSLLNLHHLVASNSDLLLNSRTTAFRHSHSNTFLNMAHRDLTTSFFLMPNALSALKLLSGYFVHPTRAKTAHAAFKTRTGDVLGASSALPASLIRIFSAKVNIALFATINPFNLSPSLNSLGHSTFGLSKILPFPEVYHSYSFYYRTMGLNISFSSQILYLPKSTTLYFNKLLPAPHFI